MIESTLKRINVLNFSAGYIGRDIILFFIFISFFTAQAQTNSEPVLGNYVHQNFKEYFLNDHVNTEKLTKQLVELGLNTFMWGIEKTSSWQDLKVFLPKAKKSNINVWVFLRPPTETPPLCSDCPYSEPYKLNFIKWAKEIAKLSLEYSNLVGYTIDDFWYNFSAYEPGLQFTKAYVNKMVTAGKEINPKLKFYPILYFKYPQMDLEFINSLSSEIDGVIAAYPGETHDSDYNETDSLAIVKALAFLNDSYKVIQCSLPPSTHSNRGDYSFVYRNVKVTNPDKVILNFSHRTDRALADDPGYHIIQIRVDDKNVWSHDGSDSNGISTIDLTKKLAGKNIFKLSIGIYDNKEIRNSYIHTQLQIISANGIEYVDSKWSEETHGNYKVNVKEGKHSFNLPLIVMPAADSLQYTIRYDNPATPKNIADRLEKLTPFILNQDIEGVITYELDIDSKSSTFGPVKKVFQSIRNQWK